MNGSPSFLAGVSICGRDYKTSAMPELYMENQASENLGWRHACPCVTAKYMETWR
jgi:hypothetical protein